MVLVEQLRAHYEALLRLPLKVAPAEAKVLAWHLVALASEDGQLDRTETLEELARAVGMLGRGREPGRQAGDWLRCLDDLGFLARRKLGAVWHTTLTPGSTRLAEVSRLGKAGGLGKADDPPCGGVSPTSPGRMTHPAEADAFGGGKGGVVCSNSQKGDGPHDGAGPEVLSLPGVAQDGPPARRSRSRAKAPKHWPPTPEADAAMRRILGALADARKAVGWEPMRLRPGTEWARKRHGHLALRLFELTQEHGAERAEQLLVAVYQAKVARDAREKGDASVGTWANATTPLRDGSWDSCLAAAMAWLASGGRPAPVPQARRGGAFVPRGEYETV